MAYFCEMEEAIDDFIDKFWKNDRVVELRQLADEHSWEFTSRERFAEQPTALKQFRLFKGKRGKRITGILSTVNHELKCNVRIYDYIYYSDGGKRKTTVIELTSSSFNCIPFHISPKKGLATLFSFGNKSGLEKFNSDYQLEGPDRELRGQFPDSAKELVARSSGLSVEAEGGVFIYYFNKKRIPVEEIVLEYRKALGILDRVLHDREKDFV